MLYSMQLNNAESVDLHRFTLQLGLSIKYTYDSGSF